MIATGIWTNSKLSKKLSARPPVPAPPNGYAAQWPARENVPLRPRGSMPKATPSSRGSLWPVRCCGLLSGALTESGQGAWSKPRNPEAEQDGDSGSCHDEAVGLLIVCREPQYRIRNEDDVRDARGACHGV